jgi:hypothetical protein
MKIGNNASFLLSYSDYSAEELRWPGQKIQFTKISSITNTYIRTSILGSICKILTVVNFISCSLVAQSLTILS